MIITVMVAVVAFHMTIYQFIENYMTLFKEKKKEYFLILSKRKNKYNAFVIYTIDGFV